MIAKARALKHGLILAQTMGYNRIVISSDNMNVIEVMQGGGNSNGVAAAIFDDCYHLATEFSKANF
jgi:hypothetical protein